MCSENEMNENTAAEEAVTEEAVQEPGIPEQDTDTAASPVEELPEVPEDSHAEVPEETKKSLGLGAKIGILVGVLAVLAAAVVCLLLWQHRDKDTSDVTTAYGDQAYLADVENFGQNDAAVRANYSIDIAAPQDKNMMTVVARDQNGDYCMTNSELQIYYWMEFYQFMNSYGSYASMFGLDSNKPLADQNSLAENRTWEQYFLECALRNFSEFRALYLAAQESGYTLPEEEAKQIEDVIDPQGDFAAQAKAAGYATPEAYLQESFGSGVDTKDYQNYLRTYYTAMNYYNDVLYGEAEAAATDADIEAYFDENAAEYAEKGTMKVNNIAVRHILIEPEGEKNEEGNFSDEAWAAAEQEANRIYTLWQENATEDNFAALAGEHSADPGSVENGGLYEDVAPGDTVTEFNDWCFDAIRKAGDHSIVKTKFGYHIMYFIGQTETRAWFETAKQDMLTGLANEKIDAIKEQHPVEVNYNNVKLYDVLSAAVAAQATEADTTSASE